MCIRPILPVLKIYGEDGNDGHVASAVRRTATKWVSALINTTKRSNSVRPRLSDVDADTKRRSLSRMAIDRVRFRVRTLVHSYDNDCLLV